MAEATDLELIIASQRSDRDAFRRLVERYRERAYWIAYNMVGSVEDAQDIAQEAFIRIHRALHTYKKKYKFSTWLYQIVNNLSIDYLRKRKRRGTVTLEAVAEPVGTLDGPLEDTARGEVRRNVRQALMQLDAKYRNIIVLRDIEGLSCKQIAKIIGTTHATARWRLHQARQRFKDVWLRTYKSEGKVYGMQ